MPAIFVRLKPDWFEQLRRLAARERRRPHDQAAVLIEQALGAIELPDGGDDVPVPPEEVAR